MALVMSSAGMQLLIDRALKTALSSNDDYKLQLFQNNITPTYSTSSGSYTLANFTGYSDATLTRSGWNASTSSSGVATITYGTEQTFTCSGGSPQTIYGYLIVSATDTSKVLWAEKFTTARTMSSGDVIKITPKFTFTNAS